MERVWPARDMAPLIALIADPRHALDADGAIRLSEAQARAILELRLARLTALGRDEIAEALNRLSTEIADYLDVLGSRARLMGIIRDELVKAKTDFAAPRRTIILDSDADMEDEDLIQREDMVVLVSHGGYIKRAPLSTYRAQRRGGKGRGAMATRDEDFVARLFVASTHQPVLFFSSAGQVYKEKVWRLPLAAPQSRGKALVNLLPLEAGERITTIMPLPEDEATWNSYDVMFATTRGTVRRNKLSDFAQVNRSGKIAMRLDEGDANRGRADLHRQARRAVDHRARPLHPVSRRRRPGVRRPRFDGGARDRACRGRQRHFARDPQIVRRRAQPNAPPTSSSAERRPRASPPTGPNRRARAKTAPKPTARRSTARFEAMRAAEQVILTVSENGYGKRTSSFEYRVTGRGGKGIVAMAVNARNGSLVASFPVEESDEIMLVTDGGQLIRVPIAGIRIAGRSTQGVIVFDTADEEHVVSVDRIGETEGDEEGE